METIKIQVKDKEGNLIAYHNDIKTPEEAITLKETYRLLYLEHAYLISINFFYKY